MNDSTYNGWTNYETWCVNLWIDNEEGSHIYWREQASECLQDAIDNDDEDPKEEATAELARRLESEHEGSMPELSGVWSDLLQHALGMTEWREIASNMLADSDVYSAGWNMPGYMPDESPSRFIDAEQARDYVADEIERDFTNPGASRASMLRSGVRRI